MPLRVFVVEDSHGMRELLFELFDSLAGTKVVDARATEAEARLWIADHPSAWDLVVIDLVLEQGSGIGVLKVARRKNPSGKIVVFSGYASAGIRDHCLKLGADAVFDKGEPGAFIVWLHALLDKGVHA